MPPKKKGAKKKETSAGSKDDALGPNQMLHRAALRIESLERQLQWREEKLSQALENQRQLREQVHMYHADFEKEKESIFDIASDMSRQYKGLQNDMQDKISGLERLLREQKEALDAANAKLSDAAKDKESAIALKDAELSELRKKMEEMAAEFGDMLKETLNKMSSQIDMPGAAWDGSKATSSSVASGLKSLQLSEGSVR